LVERLNGVQEVAGSNPAGPIKFMLLIPRILSRNQGFELAIMAIMIA
jgi:hypothetical protein